MNDTAFSTFENFFYSNANILVAPVLNLKAVQKGQAILKLKKQKTKQYIFLVKNQKILKNYFIFGSFDGFQVFNSLNILNAVVRMELLLSGCTVTASSLRTYQHVNN